MSPVNINLTGAVDIIFLSLGVVLLVIAFALMRRPQRRVKLTLLSVSVTVGSIAMTIATLVIDPVRLRWVADVAAAAVFGQGVFYCLQAWASHRVASCLESEVTVELAWSNSDRLREANERLQQQIERARNHHYYRYTILAAIVPLAIVVLIAILKETP